jgi:hypothetical protein
MEENTIKKFLVLSLVIVNLLGCGSTKMSFENAQGRRALKATEGFLIEKFLNNFNKNAPISTSIHDAFEHAKDNEDFSPHPVPNSIMEELRLNGKVFLNPGVYDFYLESFCLDAGKYAPGAGAGYLIAPLKGSRSQLVKRLLENSLQFPEISQRKIQMLLWAIESGAKFRDFSEELKDIAQKLLTKEDLRLLGKSFWDVLPERARDRFLQRTRGKMSDEMYEALSVYNDVKSRIQEAVTTYEELEQIALRSGEAPIPPNVINVPQGAWTYVEDTFYVRVFPESYSRTRVQVYVPGEIADREPSGRRKKASFAWPEDMENMTPEEREEYLREKEFEQLVGEDLYKEMKDMTWEERDQYLREKEFEQLVGEDLYKEMKDMTWEERDQYLRENAEEHQLKESIEKAKKILEDAMQRIRDGDHSPEAIKELLKALKLAEGVGLDADEPEVVKDAWNTLDDAIMENAREAYKEFKQNPTKENFKKLMGILKAAEDLVDSRYEAEIHQMLAEIDQILEKERLRKQIERELSGVIFDPSSYIAAPANSDNQRLGFRGIGY